MWIVLRSNVPWITRRCSSAAVRASRRKLRIRDQRPTYPDGAYCVCSPPMRSIVWTSGSDERSSRNWRASNARFSSRVVRMRSDFFVSGAGRHGNHGTAARGCSVVRAEKDQVPAEQDEERNIGSAHRARLNLDGASRLHESMSPLEEDQRLILLLPHPLRLPEVRGAEVHSAAVRELERSAAGPVRSEDRDIDLRSGDPDSHPRLGAGWIQTNSSPAASEIGRTDEVYGTNCLG